MRGGPRLPLHAGHPHAGAGAPRALRSRLRAAQLLTQRAATPYTMRQIEGWKPVTQAVHDKGASIFCQVRAVRNACVCLTHDVR